MSDIAEIKEMLLHLHITGQMDTDNWSMRKNRIFHEAVDKDLIKPICLNDMHLEDWDWVITKKGLKYLQQGEKHEQ